MTRAPVAIDGRWRESVGGDDFAAVDPATGAKLGVYPVSPWFEIDEALTAGADAYQRLAGMGPDAASAFLETYADRIEGRRAELAEVARQETALPMSPRLLDVELPRTTDQLREAAAAARKRTWTRPTLSPRQRIASMLEPIPGVAVVFGPNNFPFAFNGVAGGDFAAAVATGHPVIAKANPGHPGTTRLLAEEAMAAAAAIGVPEAIVQLVYRTSHSDGARLVADPRVAASGYTGSRRAGLALKAAADAAGKPIYLELSSVNPVVVLPGAWRERGDDLAAELAGSMLLGTGQFCTNPGLVLTVAGSYADELRAALKRRLEQAPSGTLLAAGVADGLWGARHAWESAGAVIVAEASPGAGCSYPNTLMCVGGEAFLAEPATLQEEAFGNMSLVVEAVGWDELVACLEAVEGNLTGTIYSATDGSDDDAYAAVEAVLRPRVGRLLNDKVPTGVAVVPAMNHGGPYPSTGHPGFTAVGIPGSLERFGMLRCYDNVRPERLPDELKPQNPLGLTRCVDGVFTDAAVTWG